jgi:formylmethanofuran dehydrogenase subunit C
MFTLTLREPSPIPLDIEGITPERVANLSELEVAKLPVLHGNRDVQLGEFFDVSARSRATNADLHFAGDTRTVKGIGACMGKGFISVENDVGMHAGARMTGGTLIIDGSAGDWLGAEMKGGTIEVQGSAGNQTGAAYRGSRRAMMGGTIVIRGNAGDELGLLMRRGMIVVEGDTGSYAGASLIAGTLVLLGQVGPALGAGMKRGTIVTRVSSSLPPSFRYTCEFHPSYLHLLDRKLQELKVSLPQTTKRTVRCYRGDSLTGSRGEVLVFPKNSVGD